MHDPIDLLVLCGGLGTRFRPVSTSTPKVLASVAGRPMLERVIAQFTAHGIRTVVLATGYGAGAVRQHYATEIAHGAVVISEEPEPRGTAGAIKAAERFLTSDPFLVTNGDSVCTLSLDAFRAFHASHGDARISVALATADARTDTGLVTIDAAGAVTAYGNSALRSHAYMSTGVYLFRRDVLPSIADHRFISLEHEVLPKFVGSGLFGFPGAEDLLDIGTPERYASAHDFFISEVCRHP